MPAPYSLDLRERVVAAYLSGSGTYVEIGMRFHVGSATVDRWVSRMRQQGTLAPDAMGGRRHGKFDATSDAKLAAMVAADVDATQQELMERLRDELGLVVHPSSVGEALRRLNLTRKKRPSTRLSATPNG